MHVIDDVYEVLNTATFVDAEESDMKRSNANIDTNSSMGAMLTYGSEVAKMWVDDVLLPEDIKQKVDENILYIHDKDFYGLTETCCQIELDKLFKGGFNTGHGYLREPQSIGSAAALTAVAIQCNQNEQHGGQSVPAFDWYMAPYVEKSFEKNKAKLAEIGVDDEEIAMKWTQNDVEQAMEALIHNLNTLHSRAGAQVPFSTLNYGTCTSKWGQMVIWGLLKATENGLGNGETPIFPVQIFKLKEGVNYYPEDPNYWLFKYAIQVSAKRLFPNFSFIDAPFNLQYYKAGNPNTEVAYMGCRTRVIGDCNGQNVVGGRGNLSFSSINLVRCALNANGSYDVFMANVYDAMDIALKQLLHRFDIQSKRKVSNYPFMMGNGVWKGSEKLDWNDEVGEVLKCGTLSIGFIGLAEAMKCIYGKHHGEDKAVWDKAYRTIAAMREFCDDETKKLGLNVTLLATPAEGLSGKFVKRDREDFGTIEGVTDRDYYTNSFHIPVYYDISIEGKINFEAPFHALCNAGHITYIEVDGDTAKNTKALEDIIRCMHDAGIGYGAINHPVDRDPVCGYKGVIDDECPMCHRHEDDIPFERIRRITGYLVGTVDRWNDAKRAELNDRVKHGM